MAAELSSQLQDPSFRELGFEDRLGLLVSAEWNRRQTNTVSITYFSTLHFTSPLQYLPAIKFNYMYFYS